jgi:hypothetical protein
MRQPAGQPEGNSRDGGCHTNPYLDPVWRITVSSESDSGKQVARQKHCIAVATAGYEPATELDFDAGWDAALAWVRPCLVHKVETITFLKDQVKDLCAAIDELKAKKKLVAGKLGPDEPFVLPEWIPSDSWAGFEENRKRIKAPLTARARQLTINNLLKLKDSGEDPVACLDQSTQLGWRGVFEVRTNGNGNSHVRHLGGG